MVTEIFFIGVGEINNGGTYCDDSTCLERKKKRYYYDVVSSRETVCVQMFVNVTILCKAKSRKDC